MLTLVAINILSGQQSAEHHPDQRAVSLGQVGFAVIGGRHAILVMKVRTLVLPALIRVVLLAALHRSSGRVRFLQG